MVVFFYFIRDVLGILFVALIFSSALSPWVSSMEHRGIPRSLGILLIYLSMLGIVSLAIVLLIPPLVNEYNQLALRFPEYSQRIIQSLNEVSPGIDIFQEFKRLFASIQSSIVPVAGGVLTRLFDLIGGLVTFFLVFVVTFYMIAEENVIRKALHSLTPVNAQPYIDELIGKIQRKTGLWLRGQMVLSFLIFLVVFLGLSVLGVEYALILAIIAGLTEFMPIIGPIIGSIPALFIAFNQDPLLALWVLALYWLVQRLENDLLVPRVMQKAVGINPLVSIIALLIGGKIGGIVGILLAIPVATVIMTITLDLLGHDKLSETAPEKAS